MKFSKEKELSPLVCATAMGVLVGLSGCSDRNRDLLEVSGTAIDSYLQNAKACIDVNVNKQCDPGEAFSLTNINGDFLLGTFDTGPILVVADPLTTTKSTVKGQLGDKITKPFFMTAPITAKSVTPLTTLVQVGVEQGTYTSFSAGAAEVISALNIPNPTTVDLSNYDYIATGNTAVAVAAEVVISTVADAMVAVENAATGDSATTANILSTAVMLLIDPDLAGGVNTNFMQEIGAAVETAVVAGTTVEEINFDTLTTTIEASLEADVTVDIVAEITADVLLSVVVAVGDPDVTGVTGSSN